MSGALLLVGVGQPISLGGSMIGRWMWSKVSLEIAKVEGDQ